jgi:hypothetical protein
MKYFFFTLLFLLSQQTFSQTPVDTIRTELGQVIMYSNRTWKYVEDFEFDGIMNEMLYERIQGDTILNFVQSWDTEVCYTSDLHNNHSKLHDTIQLFLDEKHPGFVRPTKGIVTSHYGWRSGRTHNGIDLDLNTGDTVYAAWAGKVRYAKWNDGGFGNLVILRHYNGLETFYAHLSKHLCAPNQEVKAGEPIGLGGNTGHSFGSHLHFEVRFYDGSINPEQLIDFEKGDVKSDTLLVHKGLFKPGAKVINTDSPGETTPEVEQGHEVASVQEHAETSNTRKYYRVRSGDTLTQIASRHNTTVSKLCQLNGMRHNSVLHAGKQLRVR